jgi:hypothetical protein
MNPSDLLAQRNRDSDTYQLLYDACLAAFATLHKRLQTCLALFSYRAVEFSFHPTEEQNRLLHGAPPCLLR